MAPGRSDQPVARQRRSTSRFPGFEALDAQAGGLIAELAARRRAAGLTQTEVAARMRTSQSAVARLEAGGDLRISTLERYAAALGQRIEWRLGVSGKEAGR